MLRPNGKFFLFFIFLILVSIEPAAQVTTDSADKSPLLPDVVIKAFEQGRRLQDVPASVNYLSRSAMERFSPTSIVQAVNAMPGARMEERSPGSYRFNIRGSSLRSPFGVRNVKVYYNDIPYTDPGGQTYLNQLGFYNFNSVEIVKGPGSSLYGAGTGGVLLMEHLRGNEQPGVSAEYTAGSFGLSGLYLGFTTGSEKTVTHGSYQRLSSTGFRNHSSLQKDVYTWTGIHRISEKKYLKTSFLYGDLFYETPGALTQAEYAANPKAARPGSGGFPGSEAARASIRQRTFLTGLSYVQDFTPRWENKTVLYGMFTDLRNPTLRNYEKSTAPHVGGRTAFRYHSGNAGRLFNVDIGGEWQEGFGSVSIHKNIGGLPDSLQSADDINNRQQFLFSQASFETDDWVMTAGLSWNLTRIRFQRFSDVSSTSQQRSFNNQLAPRIAVMRKISFGGNDINIYSSVSRGFSPPTTTELLPTGGAINLDLEAEDGTNFDLGIKARFVNNLYVDINAFLFRLTNTIVQRRDAGGGDFFLNAGRTQQYGIETYLGYPLFSRTHDLSGSNAWLSHTWHRFRYREFRQLTNDYSGNRLPSIAPHTVSAGVDLQLMQGWIGTLSYFFSDRIPLNDANTAYTTRYHLIGARLGYQKTISGKWRFRLQAGAENILDQNYSLGNDYNGFGGRYFNAAAGRNFYVSLMGQWISKKTSR